MQGSSDLLWEDLGLVHTKAHRAYEMLQSIMVSIQEGHDQPSRIDSQHMNRLMVLADLLCSELRDWSDDITPKNNGNGSH